MTCHLVNYCSLSLVIALANQPSCTLWGGRAGNSSKSVIIESWKSQSMFNQVKMQNTNKQYQSIMRTNPKLKQKNLFEKKSEIKKKNKKKRETN